MTTFRDTDQRDWEISVNKDTIEEVLAKTQDVETTLDGKTVKGIDLGDDGASGLLALAKSGRLLVRVAWLLCAKQAKTANVTPEAFAKAMGSGEVIETAEVAIRESSANFIRPSRRCFQKGILEASDREMKDAQEQTLEGINSPETATKIREAFRLRIAGEIGQALDRVSSVSNSLEKLES